MIYWVTFGEDDSGNDLSSTEYLPWYGESWKSGPSLDAEYARKGHNGIKTILKSNYNFHQIPQFTRYLSGSLHILLTWLQSFMLTYVFLSDLSSP